MQLTLSENIRLLRKQRRMTQEKLAEALGVTVGAVYKWESGLSQPELGLLVEMADFFDTSVDALLGYRMKDNRLDSAVERLNAYCRTLDPAAIAEAEKVLAKYPHAFRAVYACAMVHLAFGVGNRDKEQLERARELLEQARVLLPQNGEPAVSDATICGRLSTVLFLLGEKERSLELMKKNNADGIFNGSIGACLAIYMGRAEDAEPYLSDTLMDVLSNLLTAIVSYVFLFRSRGDWDSAVSISGWGLDFLAGLKTDGGRSVLDKGHAELLALLAYARLQAGMEAEALDALREAGELAAGFDAMPDYSLGDVRFAGHPEQHLLMDTLGATVAGSVAGLLDLLDAPTLSERWKELVRHG